MMHTLQQSCGGQAYLDIEMNSLEDAFINIAREEENLLADLKKHGVRTTSLAN